MDKSEKIEVPKWALIEILDALSGPQYLINELRAISGLPGHDCPIDALQKSLD